LPTSLRKIRRHRGSRLHGWGQVGQHRGGGGRGGHGQAGLLKHKWSWTIKYDPDHFGGIDLKPKKGSKPAKWLNVCDLDKLRDNIKDKSILDLKSMGYEKLLGNGVVNGVYKIAISSYTKRAKSKVEQAGGEIVG